MAPLWNIARRTAVKSLRHIRLSQGSSPKTCVRALSSSHVLGNIVTSSLPDVEQPVGNLLNTIFENVHQWGSKIAVESPETGQNYTYNELLEKIAIWAGFLSKLGLSKGDVTGVFMPNCIEYPIVFLGGVSIGAIGSPVNHTYTAEELARQLDNSGAKLLVSHPMLEATVASAMAMRKRPLHLVMNGPSNIKGALNLHDILKDPAISPVDSVEMEGNELAVLPYSSGTTGPPKGVAASHNGINVNLRIFNHPSVTPTRPTTDDFQDSFLTVLPFSHISGMFVQMMAGFQLGIKLLPLTKFKPDLFLKTIHNYKVETMHVVPPMLDFLIHSPEATPEILSSIKSIKVGGAPVTEVAVTQFKKKAKQDVFYQELYGMTEVMITNTVPLGMDRIGTSGKLLSNVSAKILDISSGEELPSHEKGEICLKTPGMMKGYFRNDAATSEIIDGDGWIHTGDVGYFDEEGFLKIVDRTKELIKVKGLQVSPSELEGILRQHPQVQDAGIIGVPHERHGEAPRAYVVTTKDIAEDEIHSFIETRVAPHKKLTGGVVFVKELPKNPTGKLLRRELKKRALE